MVEIWYAILSFMLAMYVVLEGLDVGAGMLQYVVGRTDAERRLVIAAIGPLWTWHEVWLVSFGGTLMVAFPSILACSFEGFYLALFLVLWGLVLRGVSIEVSGQIGDPMWRSAWHFTFAGSNVLLAILIGAALGNVTRGVPLGADGKFTLPFFTNFSPLGNVGILDWYTVSVAVFILVTFAGHGANALVMRTEGPVHDRSRAVAGFLWKLIPLLLVVITVESSCVRPGLFRGIVGNPVAWLGLVCVFGGLIAVFQGLRKNYEARAVIGSCLFIGGLMVAGAAGVFPTMLHSTLAPEYSISARQSAAPVYGLVLALIWWPIALIFSIGYFLFVSRYFLGKVKPAEDAHAPY
jgi:cytochrome bd ubiquinol oxidase subunit II